MHCSSSYCVFVWFSHAVKSFIVLPNVQREFEEFYLSNQNNLCVGTFESVLWLLHSHHSITMFQVSCHRCGTHHGPPLMRLFPLTSSHHPKKIFLETKLSTLRSVCLNDRFSRSQHRFTSLTFDRQNQLGVRHQDTYSHSVDCTRVPWESLTLMVISLALVNGSHHWSVIKWFLPCSTSDHCIAWIESYFVEDEMKTLGICLKHSLLFPRLRWSFVYIAWIYICMVMAMLKFASV